MAGGGARMGGGGGMRGGGGDRSAWRQAMRERMLANPVVKRMYDAKQAEDPELGTDEEKQSRFFRTVFQELSPFVRETSREALETVLEAVQEPAAETDE